ncbi:MAG TPA: hypothetical protein VHZ03_33475 [Trebonia sp.]|nr:hypothetical protein [Trebonia sp.]
MLRELNDRFSLAGQVLTADALNTQDGFTEFARDEVGAHYVLTAKKNRKNRKNLHAYPGTLGHKEPGPLGPQRYPA